MLPKLSLQRQRPRFAWAAARHDASVVATAVKRQVVAVRIFVRELLSYCGTFHQVGRTQFRKIIFRGQTDGLAELHQSVQSSHHAYRQRKGTVSFERRSI